MDFLTVSIIFFIASLMLFLFNIATFEIAPRALLLLEVIMLIIPVLNISLELTFLVIRLLCSRVPNASSSYPGFLDNCIIKDNNVNRWLFNNKTW